MSDDILRPDWRSRVRAHLPNILAVGLGKFTAMLGLALGTRLLTEVASTSTFGEAKLVVGINTLVFGILVAPFGRFVMREFHDAVRDRREAAFQWFVRATTRRLTGGLALLVSLSFLAYSLGYGFPERTTALLAGGLFIGEALYTVEFALLVTRNRQIAASAVDAFKLLGLPLLAAAAVVALGDHSAAIVGAQFLVLLLAVAGARFGLRDTSSPLRPSPTEQQFWSAAARSFVVPLLPLGLFTWIVSIGDRYVLAYFWSAAEVGQYSAVYGLIATPLTALGAMASTLVYPQWFRRAASGDRGAEGRIQFLMLAAQVTLALGAFGGVWLLRETLARWLLGETYRAGAPQLMVWIAGGAACLLVSTVLDMKAYATKRVRLLTLSYGIAAVVNVALNLVLVPGRGPLGAAQATAATFAVYLVTMLLLSLRAPRGDVSDGPPVNPSAHR